jgi:hypothetical protein
MTRSQLVLLLLLGSCGGKDDAVDTGPVDPECGDLDGNGTDTGDLPDVLGSWTVTFGKWYFAEACGLDDDELKEWVNGAMQIKGRAPHDLYAQFGNSEEHFYGLESGHGGLVFSGQHESALYGTVRASMGGHVYYDVYRERTVIEGFGFVGVDSTGDGEIDCPARGDFTAFKSN